MTSLTEFFNKHEDDALKGISHKNSIIKRNIIAYMAVNGECTLSELTKELHISVPTITKLVQELVDENIVTDLGKVETPGGRRPNIFGLANSAIYFAGINVGRDNMTFLITDLQNNIIKEEYDYTFELQDRPQCFERICSNIENFIATCGIAVPSFVVCTILLYIFSLKLGWLPSYGLTGWKNYIMPVIALGFYPTAYICRLMRSSMLDVLGQDYMRTARAKGLSQGKSLFKHALRNAILPVVTYLGPALAYTLTGSLIVEKIFTIPGLGDSFVSSITGRDYMVIMGTTIFLATLIITMNVIVDIVYKIIDPRIKLK